MFVARRILVLREVRSVVIAVVGGSVVVAAELVAVTWEVVAVVPARRFVYVALRVVSVTRSV